MSVTQNNIGLKKMNHNGNVVKKWYHNGVLVFNENSSTFPVYNLFGTSSNPKEIISWGHGGTTYSKDIGTVDLSDYSHIVLGAYYQKGGQGLTPYCDLYIDGVKVITGKDSNTNDWEATSPVTWEITNEYKKTCTLTIKAGNVSNENAVFVYVRLIANKTYKNLIIKDYGNTLHGQDRQYPNHVLGIDESPESDKYAQFTIDLTGYSTMEVSIADFNSSTAVVDSTGEGSRARLYFNDIMVFEAVANCNEDGNNPYSGSIDISGYTGVQTVYSTYYNCDGDCEAGDVTITFKV